MLIGFSNGTFVAENFDRLERRLLKQNGFFHDPTRNKYITSKINSAARLREYFNDDAEKFIEAISIKETPWAGRLSIPRGKELDPHQIAGCEFVLGRNHSYIAYEQRLGKTPLTVVVVNTLFKKLKFARACIVVPPFLTSNWVSEIRAWQTYPYKITVLRDKLDVLFAAEDFDVVVVADSIIKEEIVQNFLLRFRYDYGALDEAHRYNHMEAQRTEFIYGQMRTRLSGLVHQFDRVTLLSGTPMRNRPFDLWPALSNLASDCIGYRTKNQYAFRYCDARIETRTFTKFAGVGKPRIEVKKDTLVTTGSSNEEELQKRIRRFMKVEKYKDHKVLRERENIILLDGKTSKRVIKLQKAILEKRSVEELIGSSNVGDIARYRRMLSREKFPVAKEFLENALEDNDLKFMVFGMHVELLERMHAAFKKYNPFLINGKVPMKKRVEIEKSFKKGLHRIGFANTLTMQGVDYSAADRNIFLESAWSPSDNEQAKFRIISRNKEGVLIKTDHLVMADTLDEYVMRKVIEKQKTINKVIRKEKRNG